jgi:eukaryotic-like serine/threonine-protein kinase
MRLVKSAASTLEGPLVAHKYQLERLLGEGGMACVWLARNLLLDMPVALKLLRPELASPETAARLRAEARASANFSHPAIVRVYDIEETPSGEPCIVMELLEGETLAERLDREALGAIELVRLLYPIAEALCFVHESGFIHRDLKPENIFLARSGGRVQPKLLDFGIAKAFGAQAHRPRSFSGPGFIVGSPGYMSPEQATGAELDERADVWSLCVVLYEGLARRPAFVGDTPTQVLQSVLRDTPAPLEGVDEELARIVFNGLSKDRDSRTPSLPRLREELSDWLAAHDVRDDTTISQDGAAAPHGASTRLESGVHPSARRRRWALPLVAIAGLSLLASGTWVARAATAPPPVTLAPPPAVEPRKAEPVVLAAPPDLSFSPRLPDAKASADAPAGDEKAVENPASPPGTARPAVTPRPPVKTRSAARPAREDASFATMNRYGI